MSAISISAHILLDAAAQITVTGSYFHDAYEYDGASMHGYGIAPYFHTSDRLIEDNIFRNLRTRSFQCGANGNVVGYELLPQSEPFRFPANYQGGHLMHGHYSYANLFRGATSSKTSSSTRHRAHPVHANTFFLKPWEL